MDDGERFAAYAKACPGFQVARSCLLWFMVIRDVDMRAPGLERAPRLCLAGFSSYRFTQNDRSSFNDELVVSLRSLS